MKTKSGGICSPQSQLLGSSEKALLEQFTHQVEGSRVLAVLLVGDHPTVFHFEDEMRKSTPLALRLLQKVTPNGTLLCLPCVAFQHVARICTFAQMHVCTCVQLAMAFVVSRTT